jgi:hypothetical protein
MHSWNLQRIPIVFRAVLAFLRETPRCQYLLLRCSRFRHLNQQAEEVLSHDNDVAFLEEAV